MSEASQLNVKVGLRGKHSPQRHLNIMNFPRLVAWIEKRNYDAYLTEELIQIASRLPAGTYGSFKKNIEKYILQVRKDRDI